MPVSSTSPTTSTRGIAPISRRRTPISTPRMITTNEATNRSIDLPSVLTLPPFDFANFSSVNTSTSSNNNTTATIDATTRINMTTTMGTQYNSLLGKSCPACKNQGSSTTHCKHEHLPSSYRSKNRTKSSYPTHSSVSQLSLNDSITNNTSRFNNGATCRSGGKMAERQKIRLLTSRKDDDRWVNLSKQRVGSGKMGHLYSGSQFTGVQKGAASNYDVALDILHVDLENDILCGYLHVTGLTTVPPKITTYFEGEIIGRKYSFLTRKWLADLSIDSKHWKRFASFAPFADTFNDDDFSYDSMDQDFVYMRWKEKFLVPNHHVNSIDGASYAGFYYICYQRSTGSINGFYYCRNNIEWFQELILSHVPQRRFARFEFR